MWHLTIVQPVQVKRLNLFERCLSEWVALSRTLFPSDQVNYASCLVLLERIFFRFLLPLRAHSTPSLDDGLAT